MNNFFTHWTNEKETEICIGACVWKWRIVFSLMCPKSWETMKIVAKRSWPFNFSAISIQPSLFAALSHTQNNKIENIQHVDIKKSFKWKKWENFTQNNWPEHRLKGVLTHSTSQRRAQAVYLGKYTKTMKVSSGRGCGAGAGLVWGETRKTVRWIEDSPAQNRVCPLTSYNNILWG